MTTFAKNTLPMAALLTILTSAQGLLTTASKTNGQYAYNFATVPFLAEIVKLVISWNLLQQQKKDQPEQARMTKDWKTIMLFPVPSLIYMVHNNVQVGRPCYLKNWPCVLQCDCICFNWSTCPSTSDTIY